MPEVDTVTMGELRRTVEALRTDLGSARAELGALVAIPVQLDSMAALWNAQLASVRDTHAADMAAVRESIAHLRTDHQRELDARARKGEMEGIREDVESLQSWQTWALRLVMGVVGLAILALVVGAPPTP